jgi:prevent-host-death family protein
MTETTIEQFAQHAEQYVRVAQGGRVLVTRAGKPIAVLVGIENKDEEDLRLQTDPEFWRMIEERRQRPTVDLDEAEARLFPEESESDKQ